MSTQDVPGANPSNADVLAAGCWAEHEDGSLLYVKGTESDQVVYELYDRAHDPVVYYQDAMRKADFETQFSYPPVGASDVKWTWHDKTPFPWGRVMQVVQNPAPQHADVQTFLSAAGRVAEALKLRSKQYADAGQTEQVRSKGRTLLERFNAALEAFTN